MNNKSTFIFALTASLVVTLHLSLLYFDFLPGSVKIGLKIDSILLFMVLLGLLLIYTDAKNKHTFVVRFLTLTTLQFLGFLSVVLIMIVRKTIDDVKYWVLSSLILFFAFLLLQTIMILQSVKATSKKPHKEGT